VIKIIDHNVPFTFDKPIRKQVVVYLTQVNIVTLI